MKSRILIIDHDPDIIESYSTMLNAEEDQSTALLNELSEIAGILPETASRPITPPPSFDLITARQGEEGVLLHEQSIKSGTPVAMAFIDMRMPPGINGLETAIRLRKLDPLIYIVIVTAYSDFSRVEIQHSLDHDFLLLEKPVNQNEFIQIAINGCITWENNRLQAETFDPATSQDRSPSSRNITLPTAPLEDTHVLVVDDSPVNLQVVKVLLEKATPYRVTTCTSGREALQIANDEYPDMILLDVMMPEMDGFSVCKALKRNPNTEAIPVIFLTAMNNEEGILRGFEAGGSDFITKPFRKEILLARVATHILLHQKTQRMEALSNTDSLTGLPNRAAFQAHLEQRVEQVQRDPESGFALLFIDLDRFKPVNDELGHEAGDHLLKAVAQRLKDNTRQIDIIARIGGDEFVMMLHVNIEPEHVDVVAKKLVNALCEPFSFENHTVQIGASIGSALFPEHASNGEELVQHADMAMYAAKESGRNCHVPYNDELQKRATEQEKMEKELLIAIEEDQFALHFQPKQFLKSGTVVGVEALLRWNHPAKGLLMPAVFIRVLMQGELGRKAERWILRAVCRQIKSWSDQHGFALPISINLSDNQFHNPDLYDQIVRIASELKLPDGALSMVEMEIKEKTLMTAPDFTPVQLDRLDQLGIRITLDNFGAGRSSLALLHHFPLTSIKLSRQLIHSCLKSESCSLLDTAVSLIHNLGYTAIAEGIETQEQLEALQSAGCDSGLGYLLGHPVDEQDLLKLIHPNG